MIICFGGRMHSGKSIISNHLLNNGFIKFSFADYLKSIIIKLYNMSYNDLYSVEGKLEKLSIPLEWNQDIANKMFKMIGINYNFPIENKQFSSRRDCLQYIGSDILRNFNDNFHIEKTLEQLDLSKNYVCDDVRFLNELTAIKELGAISFFIIRPNNFIISNHLSEVSLNWTNFDNVLINNSCPANLIKLAINNIENSEHKSAKRKNNYQIDKKMLMALLEKHNFSTVSCAKEINCSRDKIVWWCKKYGINIKNTNIYKYDHKLFLYPTSDSAYYAGLLSADGCVKKSGRSKYNYVLELSSNDFSLVNGFKNLLLSNKPIYNKITKNGNINYYFTVNDPYIIENIKYWNLEPRKSKYNKIPDIIKNNNYLMKFWVLGLIDGDGSVYFNKKNRPIISLLASKEIIIYIKNMFPLISSYMYNHKKIDNLYDLRFFGKNAISFYKEIYAPIALARKWDKMKKFD